MICSFVLPLPPSVNGLYTGKEKRVISPAYKTWNITAGKLLIKQQIRPVTERCVIVYSMQRPDQRRRDSGNYEKAVTDLLVKKRIIEDDYFKFVQGTFPYWNDEIGKTIKVLIFRSSIFPFPDEIEI